MKSGITETIFDLKYINGPHLKGHIVGTPKYIRNGNVFIGIVLFPKGGYLFPYGKRSVLITNMVDGYFNVGKGQYL